ncbi:MAG: cyclic nucleotide-binding domain-containing protein [Fibrobacteria bacterium]|nr:cyclic nucleotide-binding domain-containing protein [Fibrobacteria bacterium]
MNNEKNHSDLESIKPALAAGVEFVEFSPKITYLYHTQNGCLVKLTTGESHIVKAFNGKKTLSDLLQEQLESAGTGNFKRIFELLIELNTGSFLSEECAGILKKESSDGIGGSGLFSFLKRLSGFVNFRVTSVSLRFDFVLFKYLAGLISSYPVIILAFIASVAGVVFMPDYQGVNVFQSFEIKPGSPAAYKYGAYFLSVFSVWLSFSIILSLRNILSAYILSWHSCKKLFVDLRIFYGMLLLDVKSDSIVQAGPRATLRLFAVRIVFPFLLMALLTGVWQLYYKHTLVLLLNLCCLIVAFFSISPLLFTDVNRGLYLLTTIGGKTIDVFTFLKKRFLLEIFNFRKKQKGQDYHIVMAVLSITWLLYFYSFLWTFIESSLTFLVFDLMTGLFWGKIFMGGYLALILIPLMSLLITSAIIGLNNVHALVRSPIHRIAKLAGDISRQQVPAEEQVVKFLKEIPLFSSLTDDELKLLCKHLRLKKVPAGRNVIIQGEMGDTFYVLVSGKVDIVVEKDFGHPDIVETLGVGDSFGEIALLEDVPRTATVQTKSAVTLFELDKKYFNEFVVASSGGKEKITDLIRCGKMLMNTDMFASLSPGQIHSLVRNLKEESFKQEAVVFQQNEDGDRFYIVKEGRVKIERVEEEKTVLEVEQGKGGCFGEIALIKNIPRTATVTALENSTLYYLTRQEFFEVIRHNLFSGISVDSISEKRLNQLGREALEKC